MNLDPSADEFRKWGNSAIDIAATYLGSIGDRSVYPNTNSAAIREKLDRTLPIEPCSPDELLRIFDDVIVGLSRHNAHPRMFGYVQSPGTALAAIADLLASTLNANLTAWRSAPAAVEVERLTIDWIKQLLGYDTGAAGLFVSGGSMANFAALAAARTAKTGAATDERAPIDKLCIYASREAHHSIQKAADLLGIGRQQVRLVTVDEKQKMRVADLIEKVRQDKARDRIPMCVVANAGTVMTGAVDPFTEIAQVANQFDLWMHVDAAYGGFAALCQSARPLFSGIELADSIALDPHKWLYLPVDCGCVLYRNPAAARDAFALGAEYTRVLGHEADEAFAFWDYGPELSRRFRALKVWMMLKGVGVQALGEAIEKDIACARYLQQLVRDSDDFQMLAPVELSIFCFRHTPRELKPGFAGNGDQEAVEKKLNAWNEQLLVALQRDGSSYLSNALIDGRFSLRGCVMNYRTTFRDMEILIEDLRRVAHDLKP